MGTPNKQSWRTYAQYFGLPAALLLLSMSTIGWLNFFRWSDQLRTETLNHATLRAKQVNIALSYSVSMLFSNVDFVLQVLRDSYVRENRKDFDAQVASVLQRFPPDSVLHLAVIGLDGNLKYVSNAYAEKANFSDREHFYVHLKSGGDHLYVSDPMLGRLSKVWNFKFTRPIVVDKKVVGVISLTLLPSYFNDALAKLSQEPNDVIAIVKSNGERLGRNRDWEKAVGVPKNAERPFVNTSAAAAGSYIARSPVDQVERVFNWKNLDEYPATVVFGLSLQSVLQPVEKAIENERLQGVLNTLAVWGVAILAFVAMVHMRLHKIRRKQFEYAAFHDPLTEVANRSGLNDYVDSMLENNGKEAASKYCILYIDINGFKPINDEFGHQVGDEVLKIVAQRIKSCAREYDFVARIGGDEFVVITKSPDSHAANLLKDRINQAMEVPLSVGGRNLNVSLSIGLAEFSQHLQNFGEVLSFADTEMYKVKNAYKGSRH